MRYASIRSLDISNGDMIAVSLFTQGCHFHCDNCFNTSAWDFNGGKEWTEEVENKFMALVDRPYIKRVSILGGEPLADENVECVYELLKKIRKKFPDKRIWVYTGYTYEEITADHSFITNEGSSVQSKFDAYRSAILSVCDVLVDGRFIDKLKDPSLAFRGSSNQRVIDVSETIKKGEMALWTE